MIETKFKLEKGYTIPEEWEVIPLHQTATVFGRIGFRGYTVADLVPELQGAISLSPSNIQNGIMDYSKLTYLSWAKYEESPEIKIYNGDILFVKTGSTYGKSAYVENLPWPSTINPQFVVFKKIKCNARVLSCLLTQKKFKEQIESITSGGAIPTMSQAKLMTCLIPLPTPAEQKRIATALSDIDDLISSMRKLIEKKKNIKTGVMQELLSGKKRLKGFSGDWKEEYFSSLYSYASEGGTPSTSNKEFYERGNIPFVKIEDTTNKYIYSTNSYINEKGLNNSSAWIVPTNSIILTNGATIGNVSINKIEVSTKQGILGIKVRPNYDVEFLYYLFSSYAFQKELHIRESGGTFATVILKSLNTIPMLLPPTKAEQEAIAKVLSDMDAEIEQLEMRLTKYEDIKQGMMQQLLTGKIRLI